MTIVDRTILTDLDIRDKYPKKINKSSSKHERQKKKKFDFHAKTKKFLIKVPFFNP